MYIYVYIYVYNVYMCVCVCVCVFIHTHAHITTETDLLTLRLSRSVATPHLFVRDGPFKCPGHARAQIKGALQLRINRYGLIRSAHVHERVPTKSFVVLIIGNSESNHLGTQGTFNPHKRG